MFTDIKIIHHLEDSYGQVISDAQQRARLVQLSASYGGKGAVLSLMAQYYGHLVPRGILIPASEFGRYSIEAGLKPILTEIERETDFSNEGQVLEASEFIKGHMLGKISVNTEGFEIYKNSVLRWIDRYTLYAVRSSAIGEDGLENSFAGQHTTILGSKKEDILTNILTCWASLFNPEAMVYRKRTGGSILDASMGVVIQNLLANPTFSGVLFTQDPTGNLDEDYMVVEVIRGLGEDLVSGIESPTMVAFTHGEGSYKPTLFHQGSQNYTRYIDFDKGKVVASASSILEEDLPLPYLGQIGHELQIRLPFEKQGPLDIEWAYQKNGDIFLLQARPLTVQARPKSEKVKSSPTDHRLTGKAASRGKVTGRAWILDQGDEPWENEPFILVATMTKPEYLSLMMRADGFVTERGGMTCHAAIVARELNKPCVVGVKDLLKEVKTGMMIEVDGDNGTVRIVE